jgi:hypothetical protein
LRSCQLASPPQPEGAAERGRGYREASELLAAFVAAVKAEGWESADILVRPFHVKVDGLATGLIYYTQGEGQGSGVEEVRLVPFDKVFYRPWTDGRYDT